MRWISIQQPSDLAGWRAGYFAQVKSAAELDAVGSRAWVEFQEYLAVAQGLTEADFKGYMRDLVLDRTYAGWSDRREAVRSQVVNVTGIPFDYLRDHPADWRPKTYDIDFAALHPSSQVWLGVKALPVSARNSGGPGLPARLADMARKHEEFGDKWGTALVIYFDPKKKSAPVGAEEMARVQNAWSSL